MNALGENGDRRQQAMRADAAPGLSGVRTVPPSAPRTSLHFPWGLSESGAATVVSPSALLGSEALSPSSQLYPGFESMQLRDVQNSPITQGLVLEAVREVPEEESAAVADTDSNVSPDALFPMEVDSWVKSSTPPLCAPRVPKSKYESNPDFRPPPVTFNSDPSSSSYPSNRNYYNVRRNTDGNIDMDWHDHFLSTFTGSLGLVSGSQDPAAGISHTGNSFAGYSKAPTESLVRRTSRKRPHPRRFSSGKKKTCDCVRPDEPKPDQRIHLDDLPPELLLEIFEYAFQSPVKPPRCEHRPGSTGFIGRRATEGSLFPAPSINSGHVPPAPSLEEEQHALKLSDALRIYRAKTLLYISLTCKRFYEMICEDPGTDAKLWRSAARWCWDWLPPDLADVQGHNQTSQTSWRNLVAVFMRSENGLFGRKGGGKGGVESFGGKRNGVRAISWVEEKERRRRAEEAQKPPRKLVLACAQPGPDLFKVFPNKDSRSWTISVTLAGGAHYLVYLDEHGRFGKRPGRVPGGLRRAQRSPEYFPPDVFEVEGDRTQLVQVLQRKPRKPTVGPSNMGGPPPKKKPVMQEIGVWDLSVIDGFVNDPKASVAHCVTWDNLLFCNLFTWGPSPTELEAGMEPPEADTIYCVEASHFGPHKSSVSAGLSEKQRGKLPAAEKTGGRLRWQREFFHPNLRDLPPDQHADPTICNMAVDDKHLVVLVRWNIWTSETQHDEIVDRTFYILSPETGEILHVLEFPNLYWDFRHHDMSPLYNTTRHKKLCNLYNARGATNRATRIHDDTFLLTPTSIISGSHDYCNWVWPIPSTSHAPPPHPKPVYNEHRNDAGINDPFTVLDDFYWSSGRAEHWTSTNERAGWWVNTPNQVLCFWHGVSVSPDARWFAACRPGKMFVWDLASGNNAVRGYTCVDPDAERHKGWMGKLAGHAKHLTGKLANWFVWDNVLPEQGLWLLFDDAKAVFLDRDEILEACGLRKKWGFGEREFVFDDEEVEGSGESGEEVEEESEEEEWEVEEDEEWEVDVGRRTRRRVEEVGIEGFAEFEDVFGMDLGIDLEGVAAGMGHGIPGMPPRAEYPTGW